MRDFILLHLYNGNNELLVFVNSIIYCRDCGNYTRIGVLDNSYFEVVENIERIKSLLKNAVCNVHD